MSEEDKSSNTEEPTEKKLRDARKKGDVPQSRETGTAMVVFALLMILTFVLPESASRLVEALQSPLLGAGVTAIGTGDTGVAEAGIVLKTLGFTLGMAMVPIAAIMVLAALFGVMVQGDTVVAVERIKPKLSKLNPLSGFKRLFSVDAFVEFLKNTAKVLVIGALTVWAVRDVAQQLGQAQGLLPESLAAATLDKVRWIFIATTVFLVPIALADILWKRSQWKKKQMMSLKAVRDEHKDSEGDPHIRAKRADLRRARARQRIAQAIPTASVILTNPTHFAVALKYEQGKDDVPVCVAKGADVMAHRIRELAREHDIPMIENRPLARALHSTVEVDQRIPMEHWQAVAEIIGFVMDMRRNVRRKPPEGSTLRDQ
ncbi:flagellar biosynthesis protein FlhB [uncultured Sulfitobacter sp.]|jgi:flagellar biosynthetic protein FlhB|uniref:flagellar biosynthesis protein FlhB n=1 Tax=uncultured Sulfitobacter sp. TaxID=191468 RepID=UPI0030DBDCBA|tara:strand:- start:43260 stop:44378 length:1119 start_codon:yes stop_codon:yes gene_type:complete